MEGGFFDQLEFFPGVEKQPRSCLPVVSSTVHISNTDPTNQGIYQDEESVDFSALLEYNSDHSATSCITSIASTVITAAISSENSAVYQNIAAPDSNFDSFQGYLSPSFAQHNMYGSESFVPHLCENHIDITPNSPSSMVDLSSQQHVVHIDNISMGEGYMTNQNHPAPGKSPRSKLSKKLIDKKSDDYRHKRERNNVAVRKSREKSKIRVIGTEKRVKELEDENSHLQSKITLLTKELNVLKNLFTSAGVAQPFNFSKDMGVGQK